MKQKNFFTYLTAIYEKGKQPVFGRSGIAKAGTYAKGIRAALGKKGVYRILENGKTVYVGNSRSNLAKTALRHFQNWKDFPYRSNYRVDKHRYSIEFTVIKDGDERKILALEQRLIDWLRPRDNSNGLYSPYNNKYKAPDEDKEACFGCYKDSKENRAATAQQINDDEIPF